MANQLRGLLKLFGLRLGKVTTPAKRAERLAALLGQQPALRPVLAPLVAALAALEEEIRASWRGVKARAKGLSAPAAGRRKAGSMTPCHRHSHPVGPEVNWRHPRRRSRLGACCLYLTGRAGSSPACRGRATSAGPCWRPGRG
jgi:hypothetical protein